MDVTGRAADGRCILCKRMKDKRYYSKPGPRALSIARSYEWRQAHPSARTERYALHAEDEKQKSIDYYYATGWLRQVNRRADKGLEEKEAEGWPS